MRLCFVVDGRSAIALNWIRHFVDRGDAVHLLSNYPCDPDLPLASLRVIPVGLSGLARQPGGGGRTGGEAASGPSRWLRLRGGLLSTIGTSLHYRLGAWDAGRAGRRVRRALDEIQPDLVHAMRIPLEGLVAERAVRGIDVPLLVSVWGNDFTLFAREYPRLDRMTRRMLRGIDALHTDCHRDARLARRMGLPASKPAVVLPGNGGVRMERFGPREDDGRMRAELGIPPTAPVVLNPRGFRPYVRNETFFEAIPRVLDRRPDAVFVGLEMAGNAAAERWVERLGVKASVRLLPHVDPDRMADCLRMADVAVSPSEHDGTPNTILEAMASGAMPVVGDIESLHEWITEGENGLFFDPRDPASMADAVVASLERDDLRRRAREINRRLIGERAAYETCMRRAERLYRDLTDRAPHPSDE